MTLGSDPGGRLTGREAFPRAPVSEEKMTSKTNFESLFRPEHRLSKQSFHKLNNKLISWCQARGTHHSLTPRKVCVYYKGSILQTRTDSSPIMGLTFSKSPPTRLSSKLTPFVQISKKTKGYMTLGVTVSGNEMPSTYILCEKLKQ